jgi:threonine dehydrogenase-like Zn-dependent dehydrogenase
MKAMAVTPSRRLVAVVDEPVPAPTRPTDVTLRMLEVGVCGTDRELAAFSYGTPPPGADHLVIGHESLAEVHAVGAGVKGLRPGDLVVAMVRRPCPHPECVACRAGRQDFCYTGDFTERGIKEAHGFMTEIVVEDERWLVPVPARLRNVAVLVEPLTIAEKALRQIWQVQGRLPWGGGGHTAVVLGAGPVGLLGAMALRAAGFEVWVYSREPADGPKASVASAIGGHYASSEETSLDALVAAVGNVDVVYEATGAAAIAFEVLQRLGTNGVFVFSGVPGRKTPIQLDAAAIMSNLVLRNQIVLGTVNAGRDAFEAAIRDLEVFTTRWPDAVRALITGRFPIDEARALLTGPLTGIKNVVAFG